MVENKILKIGIIAFTLIIFVNIFSFFVNCDSGITIIVATPSGGEGIIISNAVPANNSTHVNIIGNPPDPGGYVNLSFQLNDTNGGGDMEFFLDVYNGSAWINRLHLTNQNNGTWYHHEDEFPFNTTGQTCWWRIHAKDGTTGNWTNVSLTFVTDKKPNIPDNPSPSNGTKVNVGDITLSVRVTHPDASAGAKIYNVSFYEYPSGRLIGWNYSDLEYEGTKYYWYAKAKDDEYWNDGYNWWYVETYYNDTEPSKVYYYEGSQIYVKQQYTESEPSRVYYYEGAEIAVYDHPHYYNPSPNNTFNEWINTILFVQVNKTGQEGYWNFTFYANDTVDESWHAIGTVNNVFIQNDTLTNVTMPFSGLEWNTDYWWYVSAYNASLNRYGNSTIYHFKTLSNDTEPTKVYYYEGAGIYVQPQYTDTEPDKAYYYEGAGINIFNHPNFYNGSPNGTTNEWLNTVLSIEVNKTGQDAYWDIIFWVNDTLDESWHELGRVTNIKLNNTHQTITISYSGLDWNTKYYWKAGAYNSTMSLWYNDTTIYNFTTLQNDTEPDKAYYYEGSQIYVKTQYTESEPYVIYYYEGASVPINRPLPPTNPIPANNTSGSASLNFSVLVTSTNPNAIIDTVKFYWANNTLIGTATNIPSGSRANITVSGLSYGTWYEWYAVAEDGNWTEGASIWNEIGTDATSETWRYKPMNQKPIVDENPNNDSTNVAVYRKLVSGEWKRFVRLTWNLIDPEGDDMGFKLEVKNPSTGVWTQRWTILNGVNNGTYSHDEEWFNQTTQTYYWRLTVYDNYNGTSDTYTYNFFTQFFMDFNWTPLYPTQDDTVNFVSITEGADNWNWSFGDNHYSEGINQTSHSYEIAGIYPVTLTVFNTINNANASLTKWIRIDRNISLLTPTEGMAGYNYWCWQGNETNCSNIASLLNITNGWIHVYNRTSDTWDGYFINFGAGKNSEIGNWDTAVIVVAKNTTARVNTSYNYTNTQNILLDTGYNIIAWSNYTNITASQLNLINGEWAYKWLTVNKQWKGWLKGMGGDNFDINGYDVIIIYANSQRNMRIGG